MNNFKKLKYLNMYKTKSDKTNEIDVSKDNKKETRKSMKPKMVNKNE